MWRYPRWFIFYLPTPSAIKKSRLRYCYLVFEFESADMIFFVDGKLQQYLADVQGAVFFQSFGICGVQQGAVLRPEHFDVTMVVHPVQF